MLTQIDIRDFWEINSALRERANERRFEAQVEREWRERCERGEGER